MAAIIPRGLRQSIKSIRGVTLFGVELRDAREEVFVRMVVDGIALGIAYTKAGFQSDDVSSPSQLFALPRIQERAAKILEARRTTGVVSLGEVTDMLQRVFAGAHAAEEYSAAHNAALSLARIYGHVTDKATLEIIRRPSRDPDAPSEQALSSWVESLPALPGGPDFSHSVLSDGSNDGPNPALRDAPASLLGLPADTQTLRDNLATPGDSVVDWTASHVLPTDATARDIPNDINDLPTYSRLGPHNSVDASIPHDVHDVHDTPGRPENGAPARPVTGTPYRGGHSPLSGKTGPPSEQTGTVYPSAEELFGKSE